MNLSNFFLKPVSQKNAQEIYEGYMVADFPPAERKPLAMILEGMQTGLYDFLALYTGEGTLAGYAVLVLFKEQKAALLDYYAVLPPLRGRGAGSAGLKLLRQYYAEMLDNILIESEHPAEAPDAAIAERRLGFYAGADCRKTDIAERLFGVRYDIFSLDCTPAGKKIGFRELENRLCAIYARMIPEPGFSQYVQFGEKALIPQKPFAWE